MLRRRTATFVVVFVALGTVFGLAPTASAGTAAVEVELLARINAGRAGIGKPSLPMHSGLRAKMRQHAQYMDSIGQLTHNGMAQRHQTASPDPVEPNGNPAPDDGFFANGYAYAENVAMRYRSGQSDAQVAAGLYQQWLNSTGHRNNMFDANNYGFTVAGVGIFEDGSGQVWAGLMVAKDSTLPGSSSSTGGSGSGSGGGSPGRRRP